MFFDSSTISGFCKTDMIVNSTLMYVTGALGAGFLAGEEPLAVGTGGLKLLYFSRPTSIPEPEKSIFRAPVS